MRRLPTRKYRLFLPALFLCFVGSSHAATIQPLSPETDVFQLILGKTEGYYDAWSYTRADKVYDQAAVYYSKDPNNLYWDPLPPLKGYRGWKEYQDVIERVWKPNGLSAAGILFAHDSSLQAWRYRDLIWTTANCLVYAQYDTRSSVTMPCRGTQIWTNEDGNWLLAHEHFSAATELGDNMYKGSGKSDAHVETSTEFLKISKQLATAWSDGPVETAGLRLRKFYAADHDVRLYMPWAPHDGFQTWPDFEQGLNDYVSLTARKINLVYHGDLEVTQYDDMAWTTATVELNIYRHDKTRVSADGRQTLIWIRQGDSWVIVHEHLSIPMGQ